VSTYSIIRVLCISLFNLLESELNLTGIRHANCKIKDATEFKFTAFLLLLNTKHLFWVKEAPEQ